MYKVRAKKNGARWVGQYQVGCYWFSVKKAGRVASYASPEAARKAAADADPFAGLTSRKAA